MHRIISSFAALAFAAVSAAACGDDDIIIGLPATDAGVGGVAGRGGTGGSTAGNAGRAGGAGSAGVGGSAGAGSSDGPDAGDPDAGDPDAGALDASALDASPVTPGPVDASTGSEPAVCESALAAITGLPYDEPWVTADDTADVVNLAGCQVCDNTGDHIVTFTAPETATYRFTATSSGDVELAVYSGECANEPENAACGEDEADNGGDDQAEVALELGAGDTVNIVVSESCEEEGGTGTLTIDIEP